MSKWDSFKNQILQFARRWSLRWESRYRIIRYKLLDILSPDIRKANRLRRLSAESEHHGKLEKAIGLLIEAAEHYRACGSPEKTLSCYHDLCNLYVELGRNGEALEACQNAIKYLATTSSAPVLAVGYHSIGLMFANLDLNSRALEYLQLARKTFEDVGIEDDLASLDYIIARQFHESGNQDEAITRLLDASEAAKRHGDTETLADCYGLLADLHLDKRMFDREQEFRKLERELLYGDAEHDPVANYEGLDEPISKRKEMSLLHQKAYFNIHGMLLRLLKREESTAWFKEAIKIVEKIRGCLSERDWKASFLESSGYSPYSEMIYTLLREGYFWKALGNIEQLKSRVLSEMLANPKGRPSEGSMDLKPEASTPFVSMDQFVREYPELDLEKTAVIFIYPHGVSTHVLLLLDRDGKKELFHD